MVSIIVSSSQNLLFSTFEENVKNTIGVEFEIVRMYNPKGEMGICEAYNRGAEKAIFNCLCFIHEDVIFKTENWGRILLRYFATLSNVGIIGIAGSVFKNKMLSSWWQTPYKGFEPKRCLLEQEFKYSSGLESNLTNFNPFNETFAEVVALDGLFLSMKRETWKLSPFDQEMLKNFHGYDLDVCLSIGRSHKNYAIFDILVRHGSEGRNDETWIKENIKVHRKHENHLPIVVEEYKNIDLDFEVIDEQWKQYWFEVMLTLKLNIPTIAKYYTQLSSLDGIVNVSLISSYQFVLLFLFKREFNKRINQTKIFIKKGLAQFYKKDLR